MDSSPVLDQNPPMTAGDDEREMRASYARVLVVWAITLAALYGFQQYFS